MLKSLGLIETLGLTVGIAAADAAVKSANVDLVGYELAKGSGRTVIKVEGDVGAVKAAIEAAKAAALQVGGVAATKVIARPSEGLETMIRNGDTVGYTAPKKAEQKPEQEPIIESPEEISEPGTGSEPVSEPAEAKEPIVSERVTEPEAAEKIDVVEEPKHTKEKPEEKLEEVIAPKETEPEQEVAEAAPAEEAAKPAVQPVQETKTEIKSETAQKKNTRRSNRPKK
ncbi:BMC domain-containing protein [Aminipila butyrica]|uniref:BMC domain-containing protein n=1 Tax=Aminipila butyrica TaxID=433296 RepID=UPI001A9B56EA|nr:BMC domain-containing protein [Aminipila butyrica]